MHTHVSELMEENMVTVRPDDSLREASKKMKEADCGFLPVGTEDKPEGIITDRDIVIRAIASGSDPSTTKVRDFMTPLVQSCRMEDTLADAAGKMRQYGVSRLIVMENDKMCGILTFGRILRNNEDTEETTEVVANATGKKNAA